MFTRFKRIKKFGSITSVIFVSLALFSKVNAQIPQSSVQPTQPVEIGLWATKKNDGVFQIYACNETGTELCGRFVGMQYQTPLPPTSKQGNSQCNFVMLRHFVREKSGRRWFGTIYDPRDEKGYDAKIWITDKGELKVRGYLGISLFGETHTWHRYSGHIFKNCRLPEFK